MGPLTNASEFWWTGKCGPISYTAVTGSTVITLNAKYLKTLSVGKHTLRVLYTDSRTSVEFEILDKSESGTSQTCDSNKMILWITIAFAIASVMSANSAYSADDSSLSKHVINTVSPPHVKLNLFDYWLDTRDSPFNNPAPQKGINQGHAFVFGGQTGWGPWNVWTGNENHYNAQPQNQNIRYGTYPGIVDNVLKDGYPILNINTDNGGQGWLQEHGVENKLNESLSYLFNPDIHSSYKAAYKNVQGLLKYDGNGGYIFNSHENYAAFKETSAQTGANGEPSDGYFDVYDNWALHGSSAPGGQFFPFDGAEEVFIQNNDGSFKEDANGYLIPNDTTPTVSPENLNHFMGLTMDTVFLQPEDGKIDANTPMYFTFSGDDDVWVFIDNVLVSDIGGVHDECFTIIDFETGFVYTGLTPVVKNSEGTFSAAIPTLQDLRKAEDAGEQWGWYDRINKKMTTGTYEQYAAAHAIKSKSLREIFTEAGHDAGQTWGSEESNMSPNTFDQNTQHELKMFYLERGAGSSNLVLSFNMLAVPASGVTKTDQDGRPVQGAEFALWPAQVSRDKKDEYGHPAPVTDEETGLFIADKTANGGIPICVAETDENGYLSFITENRKIISFQEWAQSGNFYYVLEETKRPLGYRSKGDISLYYSMYNPDNDAEGVLLSYNYWKTGAYTQAKLDVTMTEDLYKYEFIFILELIFQFN